MRIPVVAGNWKMNLTLAQGMELVDGIWHGLPFPGQVEVVVAPPFLLLPALASHLKSSYISLAAQNLHHEEKGAFTGECSASQVRDAGADFAIIGHSERRQYFQETDSLINKKLHICFTHGLTPILCVGETLEERERGDQEIIIRNQVIDGLRDLSPSQAPRVIIAYEPVWAIGTGKTASTAQAQEVHLFIRSLLAELFGAPISAQIRILYGGSVKPDNSSELLSLPDVDGALVGGASLKAGDFISIIKSSMLK
jgi:triosephosphate isomerase (TIM)